MSLSIGMNEVGDPAGAAKISSPASRLVEMIDEELARHEEVKQQKEDLAKRLEEFRALALKDEKQIASKEEEIEQAQAKLAETLSALTESKNELAAVRTKSEQDLAQAKGELASEKSKSEQELAKSAAELAKAKKELDEREAALKRSAAVIEQKESELKISAQELLERDKVIRESENLLEKSERSLAQITQEKAATSEKLQQSERSLSRTSGQLEMTKLELEALREQARQDRARADEALAKFHAAEVELVETKSKLTSTQTQLNGMVRVLADVNSDLVRTKSDLDKTKSDLDKSEQTLAVSKETIAQNEKIMGEKDKQIADKQRDLAETRKEAAELKKMLNNDVLTSYNASALELSFHLVNDRLFNNIVIDKSFFLPVITLGGRTWLVSAFRDTTGLNLHSGYTKVTELQYKVRRPQSKDKWNAVNGPALCLAEDARVCIFPVDAGKAEPIRVITFDALRERGLDNLTLFKSGTFSKDSADVTSRCSVSMEQGDNYLYIRNPNRSSSELKAEVGDFVISKEGFFVGVVVKVSSADLGQTSTAQCYVFNGEPDLKKALQLRLTKEPSQTLFYDFVDGHESLRKVTEQLDKKK
jgi:hypothetical protein